MKRARLTLLGVDLYGTCTEKQAEDLQHLFRAIADNTILASMLPELQFTFIKDDDANPYLVREQRRRA